MIWNYGMKTTQVNCGMLICAVAGGVFEKDKIYPYFFRDGYGYILEFNIHQHTTIAHHLIGFDDGTYKIVGSLDEREDAVFKEVKI